MRYFNLRHVMVALAVAFFAGPASAEDGKWIQLFNGKNLDGWTPKIRYQELGKDPGKTFRVVDGKMVVNYDAKTYPEFNETFGHIFYKDKFSHYKIRVEYRFVGEQTKGGPGWAYRNSGIMLHGQDPATMRKDQDFPVSIEVQLLGGDGKNPRTTSNLCTPGTNVVMDGKLFKPHCTSSKSKTYHGDQWVTAEVEVHGDKVIKHVVDGEVVLEYEQPQLDPRDEDAKRLIKDGNLILTEGTISLQSESHPVEFRKVELMNLAGAATVNSYAGEWTATSTLPDGQTFDAKMELSGTNAALAGTLDGDGGEVEIDTIKVAKTGLNLFFDFDMNGTTLDCEIESKNEGPNKLVGKWVVFSDDGTEVATGDWEATRKPQGLAGTWNVIAVVPDSADYNGTLALTSKDGKVSGTSKSDDGDATSIENVTADAKSLKFSVPFERDGYEGTITVEAKLQADGSLDGEWILTSEDGQEFARDSWKATRK